jgi:capsular exopolysaccharide synthesis family protein
MELWQYYRILHKRKWLIIIGTIVCVGIVLGVLLLGPKKWAATTTVMERLPNGDKVNIFSGPFMQVDPKLSVSNLMELVVSTGVQKAALSAISKSSSASGPDDPAEMLKAMDVEPITDSMIVGITVRSSSPDQAVDVANYVRRAVVDRYNEINYGGASNAKKFIAGQLAETKTRLDKIRGQIKAYKESTGAVMLDNQTSVLLQQMAQLETNLSQDEVQARQAGARVNSLKKKLHDYPAVRVASTTMQSNPVYQELQVELAKDEIDLQKMLKDRTPLHPDVQAAEKQIEQTKKSLKESMSTIMGASTEAANPIRDNVVQNYVVAMSDFSAATAGASAAKAVVASLKPRLKQLPQQAAKLASLTVEEDAAKATYALLQQKYDEARIKEQESGNMSSLEVVDEANVLPADPRRLLKALLALILSPILCSGIAFLLHYLDNTVKTPAEAESLLKLPVFAAVPIAKRPSLTDPKSLPSVAMSYQMLSANLWIRSAEMERRTILVASAEPNVGRSVTAANLAVTLARDGARVILVDSDFRQPSLHALFGLGNEKGLSNILAGQLSVRDALRPTSIPDLLVITTGPLPANPVRLLRSPEMQTLVSDINDLADFIIFDSPSGITFADGTLLASAVKNVVIVHAAGTVSRGAEAEFRSRLDQVQANIIGVVLNMVKPEDSHGYYHFRSAYGELLREGKPVAALTGSTSGHGNSES